MMFDAEVSNSKMMHQFNQPIEKLKAAINSANAAQSNFARNTLYKNRITLHAFVCSETGATVSDLATSF